MNATYRHLLASIGIYLFLCASVPAAPPDITPSTATVTVNPTTGALTFPAAATFFSANGIVVTTGTYSNPAWITALAWSKLTGTPTTLSGYGITDNITTQGNTFNGLSQLVQTNGSGDIILNSGGVSGFDLVMSKGNLSFELRDRASSTAQKLAFQSDGSGSGTATIRKMTSDHYLLFEDGNGSSLTGLTKSQVGLGSVENTALSTWTGSTSITTLGTISAGAIPTTLLTGTITNAQLAGSIANSKLSNSAITIAGTSTSLGGTITLDTITGLSSTGLIKRSAANTLAIAVAGTDYLTGNQTITLSGDISGSGTTTITTTIGSAKVTNAMLVNSAITIGGASTSLGGTVTATTILDSLGSTQGSILYRNGSAWVVLTPGTAGQVLQSGGAAANPSWTTVSSGITVGTTAITSGTAGRVLYEDSSNKVNETAKLKVFTGTTTDSGIGTDIMRMVDAQWWGFGSGAVIHFTNAAGTAPGVFGCRGINISNGTISRVGYFDAYDGEAHLNATGILHIEGNVALDKTITAGGTTGAQTISKNSGSVNFAAAATSLVVTNTLCTANSVIICTIATNDATAANVKAVAGSGSFTIYLGTAPTGEVRVNFIITN